MPLSSCGIMLQDNESGEIENELAKAKEENAEKKLPTPAEIVANLNDHVIGQASFRRPRGLLIIAKRTYIH